MAPPMKNDTSIATCPLSLHGLAPETLLTYADLASIFKTAPGYWRRAHMNGAGPKAIKVGRKFVRFQVSDVNEWIESRKRHSTSPTPAERQARKVSPYQMNKAG